jgi:hypothetical protein
MFHSLKVIAAARFMFNHLISNGYTVGGRVSLSHDLGDHVCSYIFWGADSLLPKNGTNPNEQGFRAESLSDLASYYVKRGAVLDRLLLYGNTQGTSLSEAEYDWYVQRMLSVPPPTLRALKWWYTQF